MLLLYKHVTMKNRCTVFLWFVCCLFVLLLPAGCDEDMSIPLTAPLAETFPVDGVIDFSLLWRVKQQTLIFMDMPGSEGGKTTVVFWAVANDDTDLYIAVAWTDRSHDHEYTFSGPVCFDGVQLLIDNNGDGTHDQGEDKKVLIAADIGAYYIDQHVAEGDETDVIGDGKAWLTYEEDSHTYQAEFLFPLVPDARGEDGHIYDDSRLNILIYDAVRLAQGTGNIAAISPSLDTTVSWQPVALRQEGPFEPPSLSDDLTGLIVFTSTHDDERGEIYVFDPAARSTSRVTNNELFEENVSLSHDRTRIAFHGAPERDDYAGYEIYSITVDGTELTRLTDNRLLDGHPGWSPDDTNIAYASFRDTGASIVVMTDEGDEIADLTPPGHDDNDPDWLADGRIVFKTDRFSDPPEIRIAVMDEDGGNVQQLTDVSGVVDHDPLGNLTGVLFERLMAPLSYTEDIAALFTPWNVIEVNLEDETERTLVADVWVNWLPVYDPGGRYVAYLKNAGYTEARLMTREGRDLGRLIPGITNITYLDWK